MISTKVLKTRTPQLWSYLLSCEEKLKGRENGKMNKENWYAYVYPKNLEQFEQPKILTQVLANKASMVFDKHENYHFVGGGNAGGYGTVLKKDSVISYWYLLALLNSRLLDFYLQNHSSRFQNNYFSYAKRFIEKIPIKIIDSNNQKAFIFFAKSIQFLNTHRKPINEYVPNSHIVQLFEEVIDALVYELYFEEDFIKVGIFFIKYAKRYFESVEGKSEQEKIEIINSAYQKLREKDNEIRQNLKLMDTRLVGLIMPIKTAK